MLDKFSLVILFSVLAIVTSFLSQQNQTNQKNKKIVSILVCLLFIIQASFRDFYEQLNDTLNYLGHYNHVIDTSLDELIQDFSFFPTEYSSRDPGFWIFVKLTQYISPDFVFFLFIVALIITIPICHILYKYSTSLPGIMIGAALYEALFANFFETGIRQTVAMGMTYMALQLFLNKKYLAFALLTVCAFAMHTSALIFLPVYFLLTRKNTKRYLMIGLLLAPVFMIYAKQILFVLGEDTIFEQYTDLMTTDNKGTPVFSVMVLLTTFIISFYNNKIKRNYKYYNLIFATMACAIMTVPTTWVNSNFLRLSLYFLVFLMPALSVLVNVLSFNIKNTTLYYSSLGILLVILSF